MDANARLAERLGQRSGIKFPDRLHSHPSSTEPLSGLMGCSAHSVPEGRDLQRLFWERLDEETRFLQPEQGGVELGHAGFVPE